MFNLHVPKYHFPACTKISLSCMYQNITVLLLMGYQIYIFFRQNYLCMIYQERNIRNKPGIMLSIGGEDDVDLICWERERERERERALIGPSTLLYFYVSCHIEQLHITGLFLCLQKLVDNSYILWTTCTATSFHLSKSKYMLTFVFVRSPESLSWPIAVVMRCPFCVMGCPLTYFS